jgi:S-adenosylmethionine synthetase
MTDLDRAIKDALVLGLENDATAEHVLRIAAPFIDRAFQDQNNRIEKLEAALQKVLARCSWYEIALYNDVEEIIRKALEGKDD